MITFPPARFPTDPEERIEPYTLDEDRKPDSITQQHSVRADFMVFEAGLKALKGKLFITDAGKILQIVDATSGIGWYSTWFEWDGQSRRLHKAVDDNSRKYLIERLMEAWPYPNGKGDELYEEAQRRIEAAVAYDPKQDCRLIAKNFDLLMENTDRILSTGYLANGALGGLRIVFVYFGMRRFPVSTLLQAWKFGLWKVTCENKKEGKHEAFVLSGGGGLSIGKLETYCPTCGKLSNQRDSPLSLFGSISPFIPEKSDGYRLDEVIQEIGGSLLV